MNQTTYNIEIGSGNFYQELVAITGGLFLGWMLIETARWVWRKIKARLHPKLESEVAIEALPVTAVIRDGDSTKVILAGWEDVTIECGPEAHSRLVQRFQAVNKGEEFRRWIRSRMDEDQKENPANTEDER